MKFVIKHLRKLLALVLGIPILVAGIILIPLPGPGIAICLLGLLILSQEFDAAEKPLQFIKKEFKKLTHPRSNKR